MKAVNVVYASMEMGSTPPRKDGEGWKNGVYASKEMGSPPPSKDGYHMTFTTIIMIIITMQRRRQTLFQPNEHVRNPKSTVEPGRPHEQELR